MHQLLSFFKPVIVWFLRWRPIRWLLQMAVKLFAPRHRIGISAVVINSYKEVLLLNHVFHPTIPWGTPGGWLDAGESPLQGALRELYEETGIVATNGRFLHMRRERLPDHLAMAYLIYLDKTVAIETMDLSNEIISAQWFTAAQLPRLTSFARQAIDIALQQLAQDEKSI